MRHILNNKIASKTKIHFIIYAIMANVNVSNRLNTYCTTHYVSLSNEHDKGMLLSWANLRCKEFYTQQKAIYERRQDEI